MPDMSDFDAARPKPPTPKIEKILEELDTERSEALHAALLNLTYSTPTIKAVLKKWGYELSEYPIAQWRRAHAR